MALPFLAPILGMLAEKGLGLLSDALGSATDAGVEMIKGKVKEATGIDITSQNQVAQLSPEQIVELKKLEQDHEEFLVRTTLEQDEMYLKDTQNARKMQMAALKQDDRLSKRFIYAFAIILTTLTMIYCGLVTFMEIPPDNVRLAYTILGVLLGTVLSQIVAYFFGSSKGSSDKNNLIAELQSQVADMQGAHKVKEPLIADPSDQLRNLAEKYGISIGGSNGRG